MKHKLIISNKSVEIQTDIDFCAIEINYEDKMFINNLLNRQSNIVMKKNNKIIIISFEKNKSLPVELFTYSGACNIVSAYMVDYNKNKIDLKIVFTGRQEWERLGRYNSLDMSSDKKTWESLNEEYDEMLHNGRNDNSIITRNKVVPNSEGKKTIVRKRMFRGSNDSLKKDSNLTKASDFEGTDLMKGKKIFKKQKRKSRGSY
tara:strand:+ start:919 stop:1527 length:609 start_codon:yes stop_codon:yes gene_type:complete